MSARRERPGSADERGSVPLARLFAMALSTLIDDLHARLDTCGFEDVRPAYGFVLLSARRSSITAKAMADLTGTSKQAATKLLSAMEASGYLKRIPSATDGRERPLRLTPRGRTVLRRVEAIYRDLEAEWAEAIGAAGVEALRTSLGRALQNRHGGHLPPVRPTC